MIETVKLVADGIGFVGAFLYLLSYALLQFGKMKAESFAFSFVNFIAAAMLIFSLMYTWNFPAFFIEVAWMVVSFFGMYKCYAALRQLNSSKINDDEDTAYPLASEGEKERLRDSL